jgi:hypothetical protein
MSYQQWYETVAREEEYMSIKNNALESAIDLLQHIDGGRFQSLIDEVIKECKEALKI